MMRLFALLLILPAILSCTSRSLHDIDETNQFLSDIEGVIIPKIVSYDGNRISGSYPFENGSASINDDIEWHVSFDRKKVAGYSDAYDYDVIFNLVKGDMPSSGAAIELQFTGWDREDYLFAPASIYNGNRYKVIKESYPPYIYDETERTPDMPVTITDVPHFNRDGSPGRIEMLTSNCSSPLTGFFDREKQRGFFLQTVQDTVLGNSSFIFNEDLGHRYLSIMMGAPGIREKQYFMCGYGESEDVPVDFHEGDKIQIKFRLYDFAADNLDAFFERYFRERKSLAGNTLVNRVPFSNIRPQIIAFHMKTKWYESDYSAYICNIPGGDSPFWNLQLGWNGIPVYTLAEIIDKDLVNDEQIRRLSRSFDTIRKMQTSSGFFYAMLLRDRFVGDNFKEMYDKTEIAMIRRTALTIYHSLQIFDLLKSRGQGEVIDPSWEEMIHSAADAVVKVWRKYGEFGQHIDVRTGEITTFNSSNGVLNIAALAYASRYFDEPEYMDVAKEAADFYYERDLSKGYLGGDPAEIMQAPDSEASAELTESYIALYELTGDRHWLDLSRKAAAYFSTWVVPYDFKFPDGSAMHRINARSAGSVWASIQNEHSAPGIYIMSGDFLFKLFRATGDIKYAEMGRDIAHNVVQYVNTKDNPVIKDGAIGAVSERVNISDWETKGNVGGSIGNGDSNIAWEDVTLFSTTQNPGIYFQTDTKTLIVFDHMDVTAKEVNGRPALAITNPTQYDASVTIMTETSEDAAKPLGWRAYDTWPRVEIPNGTTVTYVID